MIRALIIALALALTACTTTPTAPLSANAQSGLSGFATLAVWGEWESDLAPSYTRLAALRHRAARQLTDGRINADTAVTIQKTADRARALLDQSRRGNKTAPTDHQRAQLAEAKRLIATAETLLEH